ncbi:MAG: leuA 6 [Firmicutes bacterium]|nr:leuA 6 [Bacillota bacterium]
MSPNLEPVNLETPVYIVDTTLRDGEQTPGVVFTLQEKLTIAKLLDEIGVNQIEAGIPIMGGDEADSVRAIANLGLKASIMAWNRAKIDDIKASLACGVTALEISAPTSDILIRQKLRSSRQVVLNNMAQAVDYAKQHGVYVSVGAEDTTRSDEEFVIQYTHVAKQAGADRLRYCDTVGIMDPLTIFDRINRLRKEVPIDIEVHTHNDFGLATANAIAAFQAGASFISTTVLGLGERAGNAALEEVIMALKHILHIPTTFNTTKLQATCNYVASAANRIIPVSKPIIGAGVFSHESGIHTDAIMKDPSTYEAFNPIETGLERHFVIGKHSGSTVLRQRMAQLGFELDKAAAVRLLASVRAFSVRYKRSLTDTELIHLYETLHHNI